jgi:hypothetical protein
MSNYQLKGHSMAKKQGIALAVVAFAFNILGGFATFGGLGLIAFMREQDLWGWGEGRSIGYLLFCVGLSFCILGVLLMRIFRNRGLV